MNKMEAQIIIEETGNYDEEDIEYIIDIYEEAMKNVGFEDMRRDKRFIVKFHDIWYYLPDEIANDNDMDYMFDMFCQEQYENICEYAVDNNIDIESMLTHMNVGHYQAFIVDIDNITKDNAIELAMKIYDEVGYEGNYYIDNYIKIVNMLQDLEDNYMTYWLEFLRTGEYIPEKTIKEMEEKYNKDKERRK